MTPEELKQLKPGDEIFIRADYVGIDDDGDVIFEYCWSISNGGTAKRRSFVFPRNVFLRSDLQPAPKYDPCRLFKKGDRVRIVKYAGRCYTLFWEPFVGAEMYVETSETVYSLPEVKTAKGLQPIDPAYLELVTPVEELEPYIIKDYVDFYAVEKDGAQYSIFFKGSYYSKAKEAAEAECARLNAEYRKGQING